MNQKKDYSDKPYNRCLSCPHRGTRCDGPRTAGMTLERWCEYMRDMKEVNGLTNDEIAEKTGISIKTIARLMSQDTSQDIRRETARMIENVIIGSSNRYPCYLAFEEENPNNTQELNDALRELERALVDNEDYRSALDNIHASYQAELEKVREDAQLKINYLLTQISRLREMVDYLQAENRDKAKIIEKFI